MTLRAMMRRYERERDRADRTGLELAEAIRERIRGGGRGEASAIAREFGWDRRRLRHWLASRTSPAETPIPAEDRRAAGPEDAHVSSRTEPNAATRTEPNRTNRTEAR